MNPRLRTYYDLMSAHFGLTGWWPADSEFEIAVGAVLTQNAAWTNVENAIKNLKRANLLSPRQILGCSVNRLHTALRPSGYFRVKAKRLRNFCRFLVDVHGASMKRMAKTPLRELRMSLLDINGIGPETADDILLYACEKPVFVVDAYTRRIFSRHGVVAPDLCYDELQAYFQRRMSPDLHTMKEYHALIVFTGKEFCRSKPKCEFCPLAKTLKSGQPLIG